MDWNKKVLGLPLKYVVPIGGAVVLGGVVYILYRRRTASQSASSSQSSQSSSGTTSSVSGAQAGSSQLVPYLGTGGSTETSNATSVPAPEWQYGTPPSGTTGYVWKWTGYNSPSGVDTNQVYPASSPPPSSTATTSSATWTVNSGGANLFVSAAPSSSATGNVPAGTPLQNAGSVPGGTVLQSTGASQNIQWGNIQDAFVPVQYNGSSYLVPQNQLTQAAQSTSGSDNAYSWEWSPTPQGWTDLAYAQALSVAYSSGGLSYGGTLSSSLSGYTS